LNSADVSQASVIRASRSQLASVSSEGVAASEMTHVAPEARGAHTSSVEASNAGDDRNAQRASGDSAT
jgi:hypothetical protein